MYDARWLEIYMFCWLQRLYEAYNGSINMFEYITMLCDTANIDDTIINRVIYSMRTAYDLFAPTVQELVHYYHKYRKEYMGLKEFLGLNSSSTSRFNTSDYYERGSKLDEETIDALHKFIVILNKIGGTTPCKRTQR